MPYRWLREENIKSIPEMFEAMAGKMGRKTALIYYGNKISYQKVWSLSRGLAYYIRLFTQSSDRVAIFMPNIPQFVFCYYGTLAAKRIAVPINFISIANAMKSKNGNDIKITDEIKSQLLDSKPAVIFVADFLYPALTQVKINWPCNIVVASPGDFLPFFLRLLYPIKTKHDKKYVAVPKTVMRLEEIMDSLSGHIPKLESIDPDTVAQFQYTGGTTGNPKAAMLTHRNLVNNVLQVREHFGDILKDGEEVVMAALPLFHIYGMTTCLNATMLSLGGQLLLMPAFDPKSAIRNIAKYKVSVFPGVNRMYQSMVGCKDLMAATDLSSLKLCVSGAGPIDDRICNAFREITKNLAITEGYGLSETSPAVAVTLPEYLSKPRAKGFIGRAVPGTTIKIAGENGKELPAGEIGEITVLGPQVMKGYFNNDVETKNVLNDGWFKTGDMGYMDDEGFCYFTDRLKDVIKVMGENIYASEIEKRLMLDPLIREAVVVGVPDIKKGEVPVALIVLAKDCRNDHNFEKNIRMSLAGAHPYYNPSQIIVMDSLDQFKNPIGKISKVNIKKYLEKLQPQH